jgi:hypothetical protein
MIPFLSGKTYIEQASEVSSSYEPLVKGLFEITDSCRQKAGEILLLSVANGASCIYTHLTGADLKIQGLFFTFASISSLLLYSAYHEARAWQGHADAFLTSLRIQTGAGSRLQKLEAAIRNHIKVDSQKEGLGLVVNALFKGNIQNIDIKEGPLATQVALTLFESKRIALPINKSTLCLPKSVTFVIHNCGLSFEDKAQAPYEEKGKVLKTKNVWAAFQLLEEMAIISYAKPQGIISSLWQNQQEMLKFNLDSAVRNGQEC